MGMKYSDLVDVLIRSTKRIYYHQISFFIERSKEFARQYYRKIGYYDELIKARKEGREEPPIPPLPEDMIQEVSTIYINLFEDITGQLFR
jgi:phosphoribosylaminoimidazole-succinocarboxamide synthase